MINYLKNIKKETLIGQLPDIINSNNESIRKEFNWIFDSSVNRLTKSVYAPTGSVKAHFGEFVNLACEYVTIKNVDSLKTSIQSAVESIIADSFDPSTKQLNHNILNHRFVNGEFKESNYMHDADAIVYKLVNNEYVTVKSALDSINPDEINRNFTILKTNVNQNTANINNVSSQINVINTSVNKLSTSVNSINTSINSINNSIIKNTSDIANVSSRTSSNINTLNSSVETINSSIRNINSSISTINNSVNSINSSVNNINNSITSINASISNISTAINNIKVLTPYKVNNRVINKQLILQPNHYYVQFFQYYTSSVITLYKDDSTEEHDAVGNPKYVYEYKVRLCCDCEQPVSVQFDPDKWSNLKWENDIAINEISFGDIYEISIIDNYASFKSYSRKLYIPVYNFNGGDGTIHSRYQKRVEVGQEFEIAIPQNVIPPVDSSEFGGWKINGEIRQGGTLYTMPEDGAIFYANWVDIPDVHNIDILFDGADYSSYRLENQNTEYQYPTYLNTIDDQEAMNDHTIQDIEMYRDIKAIQTLSNDIAIIIPYNEETGDVSILDTNGKITSINISQVMYGDGSQYVYNDKTCCRTNEIYTGTFNEDSLIHIYHVSPNYDNYWLQTNGEENRIAGHIIELTNIQKPTYIKFENKYGTYGSDYEYVILPARYPHITSLYIDQETENEQQQAKLKYDNGAQLVDLPTIASFTDINIYRERYGVDAKLALIDDSSILLHLNYSITGDKDIDDIIISNVFDYITGGHTKEDMEDMIDNIYAQIDDKGDKGDYASFINREYINNDGIEKIFAKYYDTIHDIIKEHDWEYVMPLSFMQEYCQNNGFTNESEQGLYYPNQSITFSKDYATEDDKLPFVNSVLIKIDPKILSDNLGKNLDETEFTIHFDSYDTQDVSVLVYPHDEQNIEISYNDLLLPPNNITE